MRLVLDTNVVIAALLWEGNPRFLLDAAREGRVRLFTSIPLLDELTSVLERRKFEKKTAASGLSIDAIVDGYAALTELVRPDSTSGIAVDPDDDVVIGTALAANADILVSGDSHLLRLLTHQKIAIATVTVALARIR